MNNSQAVYIKSGDQPRAFSFGSAAGVFSGFTTTNQNSQPLYKESVFSTFQAILNGTGALTATIAIQVSNEDLTGRGFVFSNKNAPGAPVGLTNASANMTSAAGDFVQALVGLTIDAVGVPAGTTVSSVTNANLLVMSAPATLTAANTPANFRANNWCTTVMGTITLASTGPSSDGFTTMAPWRYVRAVVTGISGTAATVIVLMGV